jgi:riboflavin synthase alpha subunit
MFTGLIKSVGVITALSRSGAGMNFSVAVTDLDPPLTVGASLALSGVCSTVTKIRGNDAVFYAAPETLRRSTLGLKRVGDTLNLEPALRLGEALDGHLVSGHVDAVGELTAIRAAGEAQIWRFNFPAALAPFIAEKGSLAVDGISLTVVEVGATDFSVSISPHTLTHTTFQRGAGVGTKVNLEVDLLARYAARWLAFSAPSAAVNFPPGNDFDFAAGF